MWDNVLGHDGPKLFLQKFLQVQERPHALLFCGASGLGKHMLALEFARSVLCFNGSDGDGCEACRLMDLKNGSTAHPDFLTVNIEEGAKNIKIDQIKELIGKAAFAPVLSQNKVCIINDADRMVDSAANCSLKLLEEPPAGWIFILIAENEDKLLSTILSRVVRLRFYGVPEKLLQELLQKRGLVAEQALAMARISDGSVGEAFSLLEQNVFAVRQQALAFLEAQPMQQQMNYLASRPWIDKAERAEAVLLVKLLYLLLRDVLLLNTKTEQPLFNCDLENELASLSGFWNKKALSESLKIVTDVYTALDNSVSVKPALESMGIRINSAYKE
ncbi:MAG: DNA polymerase III subunit [Acidaminococcaceae bacterium]|nr:DNA polymerase III subunit [Acidaminococcaceae bacterium]